MRDRAVLGGVELSAGQLAERFGFGNDKQWTPVADLSGGERRRLQLLRLLLAQPNVLLLDEPTNDLDTDTLAALEDLLDSWAGTLVVVSHDRYLIERVCDSTVALLGDGSLPRCPGGVDEYLARARCEHAEAADADGPPRTQGRYPRGAQGADPARARGRAAGEARGRTARPSWPTHATDFEKVAALDAELRDGRRRARGRRGGVARARRRLSTLSVRGHPAPEHAEREVGTGIDEAAHERRCDDLVLMHAEPILGASPRRRGPSRRRTDDGRTTSAV